MLPASLRVCSDGCILSNSLRSLATGFESKTLIAEDNEFYQLR